jgi:hypothetical protein
MQGAPAAFSFAASTTFSWLSRVGSRTLRYYPAMTQATYGRADAPVQSLDQLGAFLARRPLGQIGEFFRIIHSFDERLQDRPTALSQHIGKDAAEFQIRILKHLLNTRRVLRDFTHQLFAGARQIPQFLDRCRGHEARANQAMREQIGRGLQ